MRLVLALLGIAVIGALGWSIRLSRRLRQSERDRRRTADELNRRLSELFSLQELSFILSGSLKLERIVEQVVRYAMRFLDAQGALVALAPDGDTAAAGAGEGREDRPLLRVTAADGTLAALAGRSIGADDPGLVVRSLGRERLELVRNSGEPTRLVADVHADSAAAVPLRAHGVVVGTLVIANPRGGGFGAEDIRLLSTVATHAAVVIANARFFEMVRHAKEQWETAFDSLSEGIAVVDDAGQVRRANRSFASLLGAPIPGVIGLDLVESLVGTSPPLVDLLAAARAGGRAPPIVLRSATLGGGGGGGAARGPAARLPHPAGGGGGGGGGGPAGAGRPPRAAAGAPEPVEQRGAGRRGEPAGAPARDPARHLVRRPRPDEGRRLRGRHPGRRPAAPLHAVLHHQRAGPGDGSRALHHLFDRGGSRRAGERGAAPPRWRGGSGGPARGARRPRRARAPRTPAR